MSISAHCFALFSQQRIPDNVVGEVIRFSDEALWARIVRVLRLQAGEPLILFDTVQSIKLLLEAQTFQNKAFVIFGTVLEQKQHQPIIPQINLCIGLLKKEALEEIAYYATAMGAISFIPIVTRKVQRVWGAQKERERITKIMIAAAEQSKQFILPRLEDPLSFENFIASDVSNSIDNTLIYFDFHGISALEKINKLVAQKPQSLTLLWGPEGGFVDQETTLLNEQGYSCVRLTPTVLRSIEAVSVGLGMMRSCLVF